MAAVGIRCGGNRVLDCGFLRGNRSREDGGVGVCSVRMNASWDGRIAMVAAAAKSGVRRDGWTALVKEEEEKKAVVHEKMEEWMRDSVVEIVKNLKEAPLLVHVYGEGEVAAPRLKTEKAVEEGSWAGVTGRWKKREERLPDGVIFVERLEEEEEDNADAAEWGVVVQGRGVDCGPICYLLKTSGVEGGGLGLGCTHFCLMRVKSFRETARSQLKNCWLLQGGQH